MAGPGSKVIGTYYSPFKLNISCRRQFTHSTKYLSLINISLKFKTVVCKIHIIEYVLGLYSTSHLALKFNSNITVYGSFLDILKFKGQPSKNSDSKQPHIKDEGPITSSKITKPNLLHISLNKWEKMTNYTLFYKFNHRTDATTIILKHC